jgi:predicted DNA-binding transcriptional regulator YafY
VEVTLVAAWCELRGDFRHFRTDRMRRLDRLEERIPVAGTTLMRRWLDRLAAERPAGAARVRGRG